MTLLTPNPIAETQHQELVSIILNTAPCEKIFLLGTTTMERRTESVFTDASFSCGYTVHYYLLVLTLRKDKERNMQVQDRLEGTLQHKMPSTILVFDIEQFNDYLKGNHPFGIMLMHMAGLLYDAKREALVEVKPLDEEAHKRKCQGIYAAGIKKVEEFLVGAELYKLRLQNQMAAFMLHQAAEQALRTLLLVVTGLDITTHSLDKLARHCGMFTHKVEEIFQRRNVKEERVFQLLQKAYVDSRYKDNYSIRCEELNKLINHTRTLQQLLKHMATSGE